MNIKAKIQVSTFSFFAVLKIAGRRKNQIGGEASVAVQSV
jgi:hypothetical protein